MTLWTTLNDVPFTIRWIEMGGWRTRVLEAGSGAPLVLMHGTGGHLEAFVRNLPALSTRYRVIAYDYPGHGWSQTTTVDLEISDYTAHLLALLDELGIDRAHLSGESLGGWVAARFAAEHPDRVHRMVLNTPGGTMASAEVMQRIRSLSQAAADDPSEERIRARLEWLMADPASVTDELVAVRRAVYSRPGFADSMRHILCLQEVDVRRRNMLLPEELGRIAAPTLVIWTSNDPSGPAKAGMDMAAAMPDGRFAFIDDAGHWPQWEQQERFDRLVSDFLEEDR
ncbi:MULTISPECIES: alpha/beta fold hydrolase [unclassified Microbacterium]|uniref:alpha/beta fold hydrolase n=1 Tax=unclassified Microbacterium TaxID=2609290 RepID=UPI0030185991